MVQQDKLKQSWLFSIAFISMSAIFLLFPELSLAETSFGDIGNNLTENSKGIAEALKFIGFTGGTGSAVWGCFDLYQAGNGRGNATYSSGGKKIMVAVLLLGISSLVGSGSTTLFGTDQTTGLDELGI